MRRIDSARQSLVFLMGLFLLFAGCAPSGIRKDWTVQQYFDYGMRRLEKKDCLRAIEAFQIVTLNFSGSDLVDDALFELGEAHVCAGEYPLAVVTYRKLLRDFPQTLYADRAQYKLALATFKQSSPAALTQDKTHEAIRELQIFLDEYPQSGLVSEAKSLLQQCYDRLAEKDYKIGHLYFRMGDWAAARLYFAEMINEYPESRWALYAQYEIAESYAKETQWEKALIEYNTFLQRYPNHELAARAKERMAEAKQALAKHDRVTTDHSSGTKSSHKDDHARLPTDTRPANGVP